MPQSSRSRKGLRALSASLGLGLVAAPLTLVASPAHAADPVEVNLLGINDFHGRIKSNGVEAGAAVLAGAVKQIRAAHPNTVFAAAGDLIGASTFESFIQHDKPTIDALNEAGLEVSAAGNHEFDQGYDDLINRVMAPESADNPYGGASWKYISANLKMRDSGNPALDPTWVKDFGDVQVGFVGAVTEHLPELVSPGGIANIKVDDIVSSVNTEADKLKAEGVDLVVMLVHEGAASTDCATMDDDPSSDFGSIITGIDPNVDAIVSGHTHLAYDCKFPVSAWAGRAVTERPVVSAGQYGYNLNELTFQVDPATGHPTSVDTSLLPLTTKNADGSFTANYPADEATAAIVDDAVKKADVEGAKTLGEIAGPFKRATKASGSENRGGESTLGNLVAEAQRWATEGETTGSAQIAFMNPGGLRADMVGNNANGYPAELTYKQAATVQPFANTLVNEKLTGAQIKTVLEQQWQPEGSSRPFLKLGVSKGFSYTYDPKAAVNEHITQMWLNGEAIDPAKTYSVTVNSFLSTGGDNFLELAKGTQKQDTGQTDLQGMVDYMGQFTADKPLTVDNTQHAVGVTFPADAPAKYLPGQHVAFDLSSLALTGAGDVQDQNVAVSLGDQQLGSFPVDNAIVSDEYDENGTAKVDVVLPAGVSGPQVLTVTGDKTGTTTQVPVKVAKPAKSASTVKARVTPGKVVAKKTRATVHVTVISGGDRATGKVEVHAGGHAYTATLHNGKAKVTLEKFLHPGKKRVRVHFLGNDTTKGSTQDVVLKVVSKK